MKVYVASRASKPERPEMWRRLRAEGYPINSSWIDEAGEGESSDLGELWARIVKEITEADGLILYAEYEDFPLKGALVEVGIALGLGKPVVVVLDGFDPEVRTYRPVGSWMAHNGVGRVPSIRAAFNLIKHIAEGVEMI